MATNNQKTVLIVDDDLSLQKILHEQITAQGLSTTSVETGVEALQSAKDHKPDLILLDIMLKGNQNGFDVLEALKKDDDLKHIPVIVLTNLDSEQKSALSIGAIDYIVKANISIDEVVLKIKNMLQIT